MPLTFSKYSKTHFFTGQFSSEAKMSLVFIVGGSLNPWLQAFGTAETGAARGGHSDSSISVDGPF